MCLFKRLKDKPCTWVNYYMYNTIEVDKPVVYYKADGTKWMDNKVIRIISIYLQGKDTIIKLETSNNILFGVIDRGEGFIPHPGYAYYDEEVM